MMEAKPLKARLKQLWSWFRLLMGLIGLVVLVTLVDPQEVSAAIQEANWLYLLPAWGLLLASTATKTARWFLLLRRKEVKMRFGRLFGTYLIGAFYSQFLPGSSAGGDAMRIAETSVDTGRTTDSFSAVVIERGVGLTAIITTASLILLFTHHADIPPTLGYLVHFLSIAGITALLVLRFGWFVEPAARLMERLGLDGVAEKGRKLGAAFQHDLAETRVLMAMIGLSLLANFFSMTCYYLVLLAITSPVSYLDFISLVALIVTIEVIPLTPGSLGIREGAYVFFLAFLGVDDHAALIIGLLVRLITWTQGLMGGLILLERGLKGRSAYNSAPSANAEL
jgi:hypothetical protein